MKMKTLGVGNAAAMREALVQCELFLGNVSRHGHPTLNPGDKCTACDGVDKLRGMVAHALSTPPRNCDLPLVVDGPANNNADKAWLVFRRHNPNAYFDVSGLLRCIDWLLAPAEKGADA